MAPVGRPKEDDPREQKAIYPRRSVWARFVAVATKRNEKPATLVLQVIEAFLEQVEAKE